MQLETQEFRAEAKFQRVSPQKARLVLELIKGRKVGDALETVAFTKKGVAPLVEKVLRAAIQNANYLSQERDLDVDVDNLYVKTALAKIEAGTYGLSEATGDPIDFRRLLAIPWARTEEEESPPR
jgi:ribosomal protein L22